jgi:hypothetical protein
LEGAQESVNKRSQRGASTSHSDTTAFIDGEVHSEEENLDDQGNPTRRKRAKLPFGVSANKKIQALQNPADLQVESGDEEQAGASAPPVPSSAPTSTAHSLPARRVRTHTHDALTSSPLSSDFSDEREVQQPTEAQRQQTEAESQRTEEQWMEEFDNQY